MRQARRALERTCTALANLHDKYAVTAREIEAKHDTAAKLNEFLVELGYE